MDLEVRNHLIWLISNVTSEMKSDQGRISLLLNPVDIY